MWQRQNSLLLFFLFVRLLSGEPPFLFPHGYFDSNKIKPFDAIYLNLMAASNIEYGGTTVEELDTLDASRKLISRPEDLPRAREEDNISLDREPVGNKEKAKDSITPFTAPKNPFFKLRDDPISGDENPFEDIATRAPPRTRFNFQKLKTKLRRDKLQKKKKNRRPLRQRKTKAIESTTQVPPTLIPQMKINIQRLPNNPYKTLDIEQPNIVPLPIPPDFA